MPVSKHTNKQQLASNAIRFEIVSQGDSEIISPRSEGKTLSPREFGTSGPGSRKPTARWRGLYIVVESRDSVYIIKIGTHQYQGHRSQLGPGRETTKDSKVLSSHTPMVITR